MHAALVLCAALSAYAQEPVFPAFESLEALRAGLESAVAASGVVRRAAEGLTPAEARRKVKALLGNALPGAYVDAAFDDPLTQPIPGLEDHFNHAPENHGTYEDYRKLFMTEERIATGARFLAERRGLLASIEARFGVDPALLVAFVGVETYYGRATGKFDVFNALYTITMKVPGRSDWAARELAEFLKLSRAEGAGIHSIAGSYAGAFGYGQFMPSSANAYAVDFDGNGKRDLFAWPDALASVANYTARHGYERGGSFAPGSRNWSAVYAYNHSDFYVRVVLELREAVLSRAGAGV